MMNVAIEIAGRKALPVWTIPYATGRHLSPGRLLSLLAQPECDEGRDTKFPSAFNLDDQGKPTLILPGQWAELAHQIEKLAADLTDKNLSSFEDSPEWFERSIELIMSYQAYLWLDGFTDWFGIFSKCFVIQDKVPELCLNPLMPIEHITYFETTENPFKSTVLEFIVGEPELALEDSTSFYQAKALFDRQATDEEFALYLVDSQLRAYEDRADNGKLRAIFNIEDWLLMHGKAECFSGEPYTVDSALDRFRFSKHEIEAFKPEFRYVHFAKAKEIIVNHLGNLDQADRFLIRKLNSIGAYHPFYGRVLPENSLDGERWRKCLIPDWQLQKLTKDLPTALDDNLTVYDQKGTIPQSDNLPDGLKPYVGAEAKETEKPNVQSSKEDEYLPEQKAENIKPLVKRTRKDNLSRAIDAAISFFNQKPSFDELWQYFLDDKDETGIIEDYTDTHITWKCTKGKFHDTKKETLANRLSRIKI
jgi:hypothetical protein